MILNTNFYAIVPAGGSGSRLWPLSRLDSPKFLHDLTGEGVSLLQNTWNRLESIVGNNIVIITGHKYSKSIKKQIRNINNNNLILEPEPKESAAAIGLAAAIIFKYNKNAIIGSFAADHAIKDQISFYKSVENAINIAQKNYIVTIGINPSFASTGFGYIKKGKNFSNTHIKNAYHVDEFVEKPNFEKAKNYLETGQYLWNAGMFLAKADVLLKSFRKNNYELYKGINKIAESWGTSNQNDVFKKIWPEIPKIAIDYVIAEPEARLGNVAVVFGDFDWSDIGDFDSLARLNKDNNNITILKNSHHQVVAEKTSGIIISKTSRTIATYGIKDIVLVDTEDALLVTTRKNAQNVKKIITHLEEKSL